MRVGQQIGSFRTSLNDQTSDPGDTEVPAPAESPRSSGAPGGGGGARRPGLLWARVLVVAVLLLIVVPAAKAVATCCMGGFFGLALLEFAACIVCLALAIGLCRMTGRLYDAKEQSESRLARLEATEGALRGSVGRFQALTQLAPVGIFQTDAHGATIFVNEHYLRLTGMTANQAAGQGWRRAVHPDDLQRVHDRWNRAFASHTDFSDEYRYRRPGGDVVWIYGMATPLRDESGAVTGYLGAVSDISALKAAESRLRDSLAHQQGLARREQTLRRELDHRVRNNLAGLLGLIRLYRRSGGDPRRSLEEIEGKVRAIREVHEMLATADAGQVSLTTLIRRLAALILDESAQARLDIAAGAAADGTLQAAHAAPLAMIVHELFTNSLKHGSLAPTIGGRVIIEWTRGAEGFNLEWREQTARELPPASGHEGLGLNLIRGFARSELQGDCDFTFTPGGLLFELRTGVPLNARAGEAAAPIPVNTHAFGGQP